MNETKFDGKGEIYAQFRPSYPQSFMDDLFSGVGLHTQTVFADVGAGTGKLTKQLLEKGSKVYAVEPNADMRKIAEMDLGGFPNFVSVNGTAENTTLPRESVDCVTVAQAFHWFDRARFRQECRRILKPGGTVVLVWNSRDGESALVQENDRVNQQYCPNFKGFSGGMRGAQEGDETAFSDFFDGEYVSKRFLNPLQFDEQGFVGRNLSASYAPKPSDCNYDAYVAALKALFRNYESGGTLLMPNYTVCYIGKV